MASAGLTSNRHRAGTTGLGGPDSILEQERRSSRLQCPWLLIPSDGRMPAVPTTVSVPQGPPLRKEQPRQNSHGGANLLYSDMRNPRPRPATRGSSPVGCILSVGAPRPTHGARRMAHALSPCAALRGVAGVRVGREKCPAARRRHAPTPAQSAEEQPHAQSGTRHRTEEEEETAF